MNMSDGFYVSPRQLHVIFIQDTIFSANNLSHFRLSFGDKTKLIVCSVRPLKRQNSQIDT